MSRERVVVHYHEIGLKGKNRSAFERALIRNLVRSVADLAEVRPRRIPGRILIDVPAEVAGDVLAGRFRTVFGVANLAVARGGRIDLAEVCELAWEQMQRAPYTSFAVRARKAHSEYPLSAREINEKLGAWLLERSGARVDLTRPDRTCYVEIVGDTVLVYADRIPGPGGLPVGTGGRVATLLSAGIDSPVAAARLMRRGARVSLIHFHSQPFTDGSSERAAVELGGLLTRFQYDTNLFLAPLAPAQQVIATECPEPLRTILYRRMMMRIGSELARREGAQALVTGDSLGQVASQTLENLAAVEEAATMPVLRPLIGMDKLEIIAEAERLGTFEASSAPCQEACVLFEPSSPVTKARLRDVQRAEAGLDLPALTAAAVEATQARVLRFPST